MALSILRNDPFYRDVFAPLNEDRVVSNLQPIMNCDLIETENDYHVHADLPGVEEKDLDISVENNCLILKAQRDRKHEVNTAKEHRVERSYGQVQRCLKLPKTADVSNCTANLENGVLTVSFPKLPEAKPQKIQVNLQKPSA